MMKARFGSSTTERIVLPTACLESVARSSSSSGSSGKKSQLHPLDGFIVSDADETFPSVTCTLTGLASSPGACAVTTLRPTGTMSIWHEPSEPDVHVCVLLTATKAPATGWPVASVQCAATEP